MLQKHTEKTILLIILLCFYFADDTEAIFWNRRRRSCSASNCRMSSWSSWSTCHASCGSLSSQHRTRYVRVHASCGGGCPYSSTETRTCYGTDAVDCVYSSWSQWSTCLALHCEEHQARRRHIIGREFPAIWQLITLVNTRLCDQTFCANNGTLPHEKCLCNFKFKNGELFLTKRSSD